MLTKLAKQVKGKISETAKVDENALSRVADGMSDTKRPVALGAYLLLGSLFIFLMWAIFAPLDEGVPASGVVAVESKRKIVQHLTGGIIKKILVKEAQEVKAGDPLVMLDDTTTKANFESAKKQFYSMQAQADRLQAEAVHANKITFSQELIEAASDLVAQTNMQSQQQLFMTRRDALRGEVSILTATVNASEDQIAGLEAQLKGKKEQLRFMSEQLEGSRALAKEGYLPRNRWFEEERIAADLQASVSELQSTILRAKNMSLEAKQRLAQRPRDFQKEVESQLADVRREAMVAAERLRSTKEDFLRTVVRAPVEGYVNGLSALTEGSVVSPAGRLMDIVPKDEALIIEIRIDPNVIDRVHVGLPVFINLHAFVSDPSLVLDGVVDAVSPDLVSDGGANTQNNPPHYIGRVLVTTEGMKRLGSRVLQPGMPAQVTIKTGERSLMKYLLKPLLLRLSAAMKEA